MTDSKTNSFGELVDLVAGSSADHHIGPPAPERGGRTYGGQFMAQAAIAAYRSVSDDRFVHSFHGLFLRPGDVDLPTDWQVDRVRDGRSFSTRSVVGIQAGKEVFQALVSFHVPEEGFEYQPAMDFSPADMTEPDLVATEYVEFCRAHPDLDGSDWFGQDRPMDIRYLDAPEPVSGPAITEPQRTWTKMAGSLPNDRRIHHAGLLYLSDATLIDHVLLPHGHRWSDGRLVGASLDHAMWLYQDVRADEWLLFDQRVERTGGARGLATGRFYTAAGELISLCTQEGLIRWVEA